MRRASDMVLSVFAVVNCRVSVNRLQILRASGQGHPTSVTNRLLLTSSGAAPYNLPFQMIIAWREGWKCGMRQMHVCWFTTISIKHGRIQLRPQPQIAARLNFIPAFGDQKNDWKHLPKSPTPYSVSCFYRFRTFRTGNASQ